MTVGVAEIGRSLVTGDVAGRVEELHAARAQRLVRGGDVGHPEPHFGGAGRWGCQPRVRRAQRQHDTPGVQKYKPVRFELHFESQRLAIEGT